MPEGISHGNVRGDVGIFETMHDFDVGNVFVTQTHHKSKTGFYVLGAVAFVALIVFLFANNFLSIFFIACAFAAANALIRMYKAYVTFPLELEITTFATVIMTLAHGFGPGLFTALFVGFFGEVFTGINVYSPITLGSYCIAAMLATLFPASMFLLAGIIISVVITGGSYLLYKITQSFTPFENVMYAATNLVGNMYFFIAFGWVARLIL